MPRLSLLALAAFALAPVTIIKAQSKSFTTAGPQPEIAVRSNPVNIEIISSNGPPTVAAVQWGDPVDGISVHLHADQAAGTVEDSLTFRANVVNEGNHDFFVPAGEMTGEVELDGLWHHWAGPINLSSSFLPPGRQHNGITVNLPSSWRSKGGNPLLLTPGRHTIRFVVNGSAAKPGGASVRAMSNPVEVNLSLGSRRVDLVRKYLPGYALRAVASTNGGQESVVEVLSTPSGQEIDLDSARAAWNGIVSGLHWHAPPAYNPKLTEIIPLMHLKVATAEEAVDISRMILGLFHGPFAMGDLSRTAERWEGGWLVSPNFIPSAAMVHYLGPLQLILEDGILKDVKEFPMGSIPNRLNVRVEGRVVDDETGQPITRFVVQWGEANRQKPAETSWGETFAGPNAIAEGGFAGRSVKIGKAWARILAEGYLPTPVTPEPVTASVRMENLVVRLKRARQ